MEIKETATETSTQAIAPAGTDTTVITVDANEDHGAKYSTLEAEKAKLMEEKENYRLAYLKEKSRKDSGENVDDEERLRTLMREELAKSRIADIAVEQEALITKISKENKELKLANMNKATISAPASIGSHSETPQVKDTLVTTEQMAYFKSLGWSDAKIDLYKKNLQKRSGR
jgi:hypothetical protein